MEMKKCKECGKLFMPKSTRSQYCDDLHYRPCPVCQKSVEAKYLSDPPRCCSKECQQILKKQNRPNLQVNEIGGSIGDSDIQIEADDSTTVVNVLSDISGHNIHPQLSSEGQFILEDSEVRTYVGKSSSKFIQGHTYAIKVSRDPDYGNYLVKGYYDLSEDEQCDALSIHASMISLNQFFLPVSKQIVARR